MYVYEQCTMFYLGEFVFIGLSDVETLAGDEIMIETQSFSHMSTTWSEIRYVIVVSIVCA